MTKYIFFTSGLMLTFYISLSQNLQSAYWEYWSVKNIVFCQNGPEGKQNISGEQKLTPSPIRKWGCLNVPKWNTDGCEVCYSCPS